MAFGDAMMDLGINLEICNLVDHFYGYSNTYLMAIGCKEMLGNFASVLIFTFALLLFLLKY